MYFDNSATTPLCDGAKKNIALACEKLFGNPSSLHAVGMDAEEFLTEAREFIASSIGAKANEIFFTSGGTQSNNIAILGTALAGGKHNSKRTIITTSGEHPSVSKCMDFLEENGFNIVRLSLDKFGNINLDEFKNALSKDVLLVSIMCVNNELGTIYPISEISKIAKSFSKDIVVHSDCVRAYGKLPLNVRSLGVDLLSISSHKIHGPKGAGALFVKSGTKIKSPIFGGGRESGIRSGTEPTPAIFGFYGAAKEINIKNDSEKVKKLSDHIRAKLSEIDGITINSAENALPNILNISLPGYPSETLLNFLSAKNIFVSSGSACSKGHKSSVLLAAGIEPKLIDSSLRLSFSKRNTIEEADEFEKAIREAMRKIRKKNT